MKFSEDELKVIVGKIWRGSEVMVFDAKGVIGGIGIMWNPREVALSNFIAMQFSLSVAFQILGTSTRGFLTNLYGPPHAKKKLNFLELLGMLKMEAGGKP